MNRLPLPSEQFPFCLLLSRLEASLTLFHDLFKLLLFSQIQLFQLSCFCFSRRKKRGKGSRGEKEKRREEKKKERERHFLINEEEWRATSHQNSTLERRHGGKWASKQANERSNEAQVAAEERQDAFSLSSFVGSRSQQMKWKREREGSREREREKRQ